MSGWFRGDCPAVSPLNRPHMYTAHSLTPAVVSRRAKGQRWMSLLVWLQLGPETLDFTDLWGGISPPIRAKNMVAVLRAVAPGWLWWRQEGSNLSCPDNLFVYPSYTLLCSLSMNLFHPMMFFFSFKCTISIQQYIKSLFKCVLKHKMHLPKNCSHYFPRRQNITLTDDYRLVCFNSVFRALERFGVLSEELEKLGGARMFEASLLKIMPLVTKITGNTEAIVPFTSWLFSK